MTVALRRIAEHAWIDEEHQQVWCKTPDGTVTMIGLDEFQQLPFQRAGIATVQMVYPRVAHGNMSIWWE